MRALTIQVSPVPPFRLDLTALALRRRPVNAIDTWNGEIYSRVLAIDNVPMLVEVAQSGGARAPRLQVKATAHRMPRNARMCILRSMERLLGLRIDLRPFYRFARTDRRLNKLAERFIGVKPPRFPSVFEAIVNGIACQQLSLHVGLILLNRLAARIAVPFQTPNGKRYAFPNPQDLSECPMRVFRRLGFSTNKGTALKQIAREIVAGQFDPEGLADLANEEAMQRLLALRGIGRWTAEYVLLRGLGRTDVFPADDVGAQNRLAKWLKLKGTLDYVSVNRKLARWRPYSGLIYFHLLLDGLELLRPDDSQTRIKTRPIMEHRK